MIAGNTWWIAMAWHSNVGGSVALLPADQPGRRPGNPPLLHAHSGQINDMAWNPFHEWILATAGSDGLAKVWKLPEQGLTSDTSEAHTTLQGHGKRVDTLAWHPTAVNILATGGSDNTVRVWDIADASSGAKHTLSHFADNIDNIAWNYNGSLLAVVSRDKKLRVFDPRTTSITAVRKSPNSAAEAAATLSLLLHFSEPCHCTRPSKCSILLLRLILTECHRCLYLPTPSCCASNWTLLFGVHWAISPHLAMPF